MTVKPWAGFIADIPDDQIEDGHDIVVFGGRNVAVALGEILTGLGCRVSAPEDAGLRGWEFELYYQGHRFWCQVTSFHPVFHLLFDDPAITRAARAKSASAYAEIVDRLAATLVTDPRFHDIVWCSREDGPPDPDDILPPELRPPPSVQYVERAPKPMERRDVLTEPRDVFRRPSLSRSLILVSVGLGVLVEACALDANGNVFGIVVLPIGGFAAFVGVLGLRTWWRSRSELREQIGELEP